MAEVCDTFVAGHFSVQMSKGHPFGQNEADKTIENTINRDCKTAGGILDSAQTSRPQMLRGRNENSTHVVFQIWQTCQIDDRKRLSSLEEINYPLA